MATPREKSCRRLALTTPISDSLLVRTNAPRRPRAAAARADRPSSSSSSGMVPITPPAKITFAP